jgi:hypothetical protein
MSTFSINYQNNDLEVEQQGIDLFSVHLPGRTVQLLLKQDNEGANHWFEAGTDNESEQSKAIGVAIETHLPAK